MNVYAGEICKQAQGVYIKTVPPTLLNKYINDLTGSTQNYPKWRIVTVDHTSDFGKLPFQTGLLYSPVFVFYCIMRG